MDETTHIPHPAWSYPAVIYELNVRQLTPEGTFAAAEKHLPRLRELGIEPAGRDKRAVLYRESQFVAICEAIAGRAIAAKRAALLTA